MSKPYLVAYNSIQALGRSYLLYQMVSHLAAGKEISSLYKSTSLTLQTGACAEVNIPEIPEAERINIETYQYKPSLSQVRAWQSAFSKIPTPDFLQDVSDADLVISHAGAGTCIEVLQAGKTLAVIVNDSLMDNHQVELAEKLAEV